jgi:hypothetical protein
VKIKTMLKVPIIEAGCYLRSGLGSSYLGAEGHTGQDRDDQEIDVGDPLELEEQTQAWKVPERIFSRLDAVGGLLLLFLFHTLLTEMNNRLV